MSPIWDDLAQKIGEEDEIGSKLSIAKVDCTVEINLCYDHGIQQ